MGSEYIRRDDPEAPSIPHGTGQSLQACGGQGAAQSLEGLEPRDAGKERRVPVPQEGPWNHSMKPWIKIFLSPEMLAMTGRMTDGGKSPFSQWVLVSMSPCPLFTALARP